MQYTAYFDVLHGLMQGIMMVKTCFHYCLWKVPPVEKVCTQTAVAYAHHVQFGGFQRAIIRRHFVKYACILSWKTSCHQQKSSVVQQSATAVFVRNGRAVDLPVNRME